MKSKPVAAPAPIPTSNYFNQFQAPQQYATPQAIVQQVVKAPTAPTTNVVQVRPAQQQAAPQQVSPVIRDRYGQFQDPMFASIKSTPSVMRPQLHGEAFPQRIAKNMLLASAESAIGELLLGVRQFLWAPRDDEEK